MLCYISTVPTVYLNVVHNMIYIDTTIWFRTALFHYVDIVALPRTHILKELSRQVVVVVYYVTIVAIGHGL